MPSGPSLDGHWRAGRTGEFQGIPPTGNKFEMSGIWLGRIKDGKLAEAWEESDMLGMMQHIGMELKPKQAEKK